MTTRSNNLPESERHRRPTSHRKAVMIDRWLGYGRQLLSFALLLSFLNSICLPAQPNQRPAMGSGQTRICTAQHPEPLPDYLVDNCPKPAENAPDEEGDSSETVEIGNDFLADGTDTLQFGRLLLNQLGYGDLNPQWCCWPLQSFSPPPERLSPILSA